MPGPYSEDLPLRVAKAVKSGKTTREVSAHYQVSPAFAFKAHQLWKKTGHVQGKQIGDYRRAPTVLQRCHALALLHGTGDHRAMAGGFGPAEFREHGANGK
jgi:hypothetical protein